MRTRDEFFDIEIFPGIAKQYFMPTSNTIRTCLKSIYKPFQTYCVTS
jgi:hypothetical protein